MKLITVKGTKARNIIYCGHEKYKIINPKGFKNLTGSWLLIKFYNKYGITKYLG